MGTLAQAFPNLQHVWVDLATLNTKLRDVYPVLMGTATPASITAFVCRDYGLINKKISAALIRRTAASLEYLDLGIVPMMAAYEIIWGGDNTADFSRFPRLRTLRIMINDLSTTAFKLLHTLFGEYLELYKVMTLAAQLESLGSVLKSQIMSDLSSWEDRSRNDAQSSRGKRFANKRARTQPLPEIPHNTLVEIRRVRHALYTENGNTAETISSWAIGVLSVFVSVADMRGNCKLSDLIGLPGTKAVFQLLVLAVESSFSRLGVEEAETALITNVVSKTKDPRAVGWILNQYGTTHITQFPRCLHLYAISQLAKGYSAACAENTGLVNAIGDVAAAHSTENARALDSILDMYRNAVAEQTTHIANGSVAEDDLRRFILFYMLQQHRLMLQDGEEKSGWLSKAICFEMRTGFSKFLVSRDDATVSASLADSVEVLYGDMGKTKKLSDHPLDIGRVLEVFELQEAVVQGSLESFQDSQETKDAEADDENQHMGDPTISSAQEQMEFIDACERTLRRLIGREKELVILGHLPKAVKSMPQPIPNGLQEAAQRGGRTYNNGPITLPSMNRDEVEGLCKRLFDFMARAARQVSRPTEASDSVNYDTPAERYYSMLNNSAPILIEAISARLESISMVKTLIQCVVNGWPQQEHVARSTDRLGCLALYRSLLAIAEGSRGLLFSQLLHIFASNASKCIKHPDPVRVQHMISMLAKAVDHQVTICRDPLHACETLLGAEEVVGNLCGVLTLNWRPLWMCCFKLSLDEGDALLYTGAVCEMRIMLVRALTQNLTLRTPLRMIEQIAVADHALLELARIQDAMSQDSFGRHSESDVISMVTLARALLSLILVLAGSPGIERIAMEKILRIILLRTPAADTMSFSDAISETFAIADSDSTNNMLRSTANGNAESSSLQQLSKLLDGHLLPGTGSIVSEKQGKKNLELAQQLLWQNAVRPIPRYPRSGMLHNYDHIDDAWSFEKPKKQSSTSNSSNIRTQAADSPLLVLTLLVLAQNMPSGSTALGQLLEEYYIDSIPSMSPALLDERLSSGRLQLGTVEMELLQDIRRNRDLELVVLEMLSDSTSSAVIKPLISALMVALVVFWNGALGEPTTKRQDDLAFTIRLVTHVVNAYGGHDPRSRTLARTFASVSGKDLAQILYQCVWRWVVHQMPSAEDESLKTFRHIMRRNIIRTAPLFDISYPFPT
ncbi:hypothetical protein H4S08_002753 [Coemansia sp. RSA 1365]|nr:hypothetical protein H4S08_002753 [Coemansia sp. RSA 1365]